MSIRWLVLAGVACGHAESPGSWDTQSSDAAAQRHAGAVDTALPLDPMSDACPDDPYKDAPGFCGCDYIDMDLATPEGADTCVHIDAQVDGTVSAGATIHALALVGAGSVVGPGATLGVSSILAPGAVLEEDADVARNVIVGRRATVGARSVIGPNSVLARVSRVGEDVDASEGSLVLGYAASLGDRCELTGPGVILGSLVQVGSDCRLGTSTVIARSTVLGDGAVIGDRVVIGPGVNAGFDLTIGQGTRIRKDVVMGDAVTVGASVRMGRNTQLDWGVEVGDSAVLRAGVVAGSNAIIGAGVYLPRNAQVPARDLGPCVLLPREEPGPTMVIDTPTIIAAGDDTYTCADVIVSSTVTLEGAHAWRSLTVAATGRIQHPAGSVFGVSLELSGPLVVEANGQINVAGLGGRGESDAVSPAERWSAEGPVLTGESRAAGGAYGARGESGQTSIYGLARDPVEFGSGGGRHETGTHRTNGGNGGGRIDITATDAVINGTLNAQGNSCARYCGGGSGGAIRLRLSGELSGSGSMTADGGLGTSTGAKNGGGGRVAVTGFTSGSFSGALSGGTVIVLGASGQDGIYQTDGNSATLAVPAGETASFIRIAGNSAMTVDVPHTQDNLLVSGTLTMNAPLTVTDTLTMSGGGSIFNDMVTVNTWIQTSGAPRWRGRGSVDTWTQSNGGNTFETDVAIGSYTQTGGQNTLIAGTTLAPNAFSMSNSVLTNSGTLEIPSLTPSTVSGSTSLRNRGVIKLADASVVEFASGVTYQHDGELRGFGGVDGAFGNVALRTGSLVEQTQQSLDGIQWQVDDFTVESGARLDVSGQGGRGETSTALGQRWSSTGPVDSTTGAFGRGATYGARGESDDNVPYGSALNPMEWGSGGGRGNGSYSPSSGGNGGGRIDISATTATIDGSVYALGSSCWRYCGAGAGGAIRLLLTGALAGDGIISAAGGGGTGVGSRVGGGGRVAVTGFTSGGFSGALAGGTVVVRGASGQDGIYLTDGNSATLTVPVGETASFIRVAGNSIMTLDVPHTQDNLELNGSLTTNAPLTITDTLSVSGGSSVFTEPLVVQTVLQTQGSMMLAGGGAVTDWTMTNGSNTFDSDVSVASYTQSDGSTHIRQGATFAPGFLAFTGVQLNNYGVLVLPAFNASTIGEGVYLRNHGAIEVADGNVELAANVRYRHQGVIRTVNGTDGVLANIHLYPSSRIEQTSQWLDGVQLTATGTLTIDAGAQIDVTGRGGVGGDVGQTWSATGATTTSGAVNGGGGSYGSSGGGTTNIAYGLANNPVEYGSGGGKLLSQSRATTPGNGGGRIDLSGSVVTLNGTLRADGNNCSRYCGAGSGGAIRVEATSSLSGSGTLSAIGGSGIESSARDGGGGRIALVGPHTGSFTGTAVAGTVFKDGAIQ